MIYFVVDLIDCVERRDVPFIGHATCCLFLGRANYVHPACRALRMSSKAALLECSSPFLHFAKRTRQPLHFVLFAVVFTVCRIVWIPILMMQLLQYNHDNDGNDDENNNSSRAAAAA